MLLLAALSFAVASQPAVLPKKPVKVFILAGQSNMEGQAVVDLTGKDYNGGKGTLATLLDDPAKSARLKHLRNPNGTWKVRDDVFVRFQREGQPLLSGPLGLGFSVYGDAHHFGPELQFGHVLGDAVDNPVLLIKTAWGGKSLYKDFRPPSSGGEVGKYYKLMISQVRDSLARMETEFPSTRGAGYELSGLVWYQGWNDGVNPKTAVPEYEQNLVNLIKDVRTEFKSPKLPVVIGELTGPWVKADAGWEALRKAQAEAANRTEFEGNVAFVPTRNFVRKAEDSPNPSHGHHEFGNAETYFLVGDALGKGMVKLLNTNTTIKDFGLKPYLRTSKALPHVENQTWKLVCGLPYNCHFQPWIELEAEPGQEILFNSSNPLVQYLTPTEKCTTRPGTQKYEAKNWVSGEGAIYTIPAGVKVKSVQYRETGFDTSFAGSFRSNDEDYNILWQKAARTAYICMRDHFYDCPDRERVGFWGDGTPELNQCFYVFDSRAHTLAKDLVLRPLQPKFYPGQHLEFLGDYGLWFYYLQTGDAESMRAIYDQTKTFLFDTYKFGNPRTWFDWGKEVKDTAVIETCFYYNCLGTLRKIAAISGHESDFPEIDRRLHEIQSTFDSKYWQGGFYKSSQVQEPDDRANAMAINVGLADRSKWNPIFENVLTKKTYSSCFFDRWVFEAMSKIGKQDYALMRMYTRYKTMIPASFTTLWEHYDRWWASHIDSFDEGSSLNHGWNPPAIFLSQTIAGVSPEGPGWSTFHVLPREAFLKSINVVVPTIRGSISVAIKKSSTTYSLSVDVPAKTEAVVGIPKAAFKQLATVKFGGKTVWSRGTQTRVPGVTWVGEDGEYLKFKVPAGKVNFTATGTLFTESPKPPASIMPVRQGLDKSLWTASASVPDTTFPFSGANIPIDISAANAIDGDHWNGWRDMTKTQYPGQWFQVDMKRKESFNEIVLDNSWSVWDSPAGYSLVVSDDGEKWSEPVATGKGSLGITTISFPTQTARYFRIIQTGSDAKYHWSIYELDVYGPKRGGPPKKVESPRVLDYLQEISGKKTISGIHNREPNSQPRLQTDKIQALTGEFPALWSGDFLFSEADVKNRWTMINECLNQWNQGSIVQLLFHVAPPNQPEVCKWEGGIKSHLSDMEWKDLITEGGQLNRVWKSRLDGYAQYLSYLKDHGVQVLVRPLHEMNQGAFWWGGRKGPLGTARLFQITHDYLKNEKRLTNLIWTWDMQDMSRDFAEYNPGDAYWDVFAFDVYGDGYKQSWYDYILSIVGNKPIAIGECDKLPSPEILQSQPRWCFFMSWAELTFNHNSNKQITDLYRSPRVVTQKGLPSFK